MTISVKLTRGEDGKLRREYYNKELGFYFYTGYAKDFQSNIIIKQREQSAQELIDEI